MLRRKSDKKGLTVVEVIVASVIVAVMTYLVTQLYIQGIRLWNISTVQSDLRSTGRYALSRITDELRLATRAESASPPNLAIPLAPNNNQITYYHPLRGANNTIVSDAAGLIVWDVNTPRQLRHVPATNTLEGAVGGTVSTIAQNINRVVFEDSTINATLSSNELRVSLELSAATPLFGASAITMVSKIKIRSQE